MAPRRAFPIAVFASLALLTGCNDTSPPAARLLSPEAASLEVVYPGAAAFVTGISNPYLNFVPGQTFRYEGMTDEGLETIVVEVTHKTKRILGVATTVLRDRVYLDGDLVEDTLDWYAEDNQGNVWYFGEDSKEIEDGEVVSTEGSWQAGVNGAMPGIIMLANPEKGDAYQQELAEGVAEDEARVVSLSEAVTVPYGPFTGCLQTLEWTSLEPGAREYKFYAPGTGLVLELGKQGGRVELVSID